MISNAFTSKAKVQSYGLQIYRLHAGNEYNYYAKNWLEIPTAWDSLKHQLPTALKLTWLPNAIAVKKQWFAAVTKVAGHFVSHTLLWNRICEFGWKSKKLQKIKKIELFSDSFPTLIQLLRLSFFYPLSTSVTRTDKLQTA